MTDRAKQLAEWDAANRKHIADLTDTYIKKLAVTSGIYDCITDPYDALKNGDQYSSVMPDLIRFAQLIIQECAAIANAGIDPTKSHLIGDDILLHFGVEE